MRITPDNIQSLNENEIFVFGSNESGIHGGGAAKTALELFGAKSGVGFGPQGQSFAIPTKNWRIGKLSPIFIHQYVIRFLVYASLHPELKFYVTEIGCGLAGYTPEDIAWMFEESMEEENIYLPQRFIDILNGKDV
jgi:hypothetical protein